MVFNSNQNRKFYFIDGPVGELEVCLDSASTSLNSELSNELKGLAIVCHPHTLYGGTMDHKVVTTLSRTFQTFSYDVVRFNFRGAGKSSGKFDNGDGEQDDLRFVVHKMVNLQEYQNSPIILAGFSFGAYVASLFFTGAISGIEKANRLKRLILVGAPSNKWNMPFVPSNTIIIHGEKDQIVSLDAVSSWGGKMGVPVHVIKDADHFFHCKLHLLQQTVVSLW